MRRQILAAWVALSLVPVFGQAEEISTIASTQETTAEQEQMELLAHDPDAFRDIGWDMAMADVASAEGVKMRKSDVQVTEDLQLYQLDASKLTYRYAQDVLISRTFTMKKNHADTFSALFLSLCKRYGVPMQALKRTAMWQYGEMTITMQRGKALTVTYTRSISLSPDEDGT